MYKHVEARDVYVDTRLNVKGGCIVAKTATLTIQQWGNSLAVRLPAAVARSAHFEVGQEVEVTTQEVGVTVKPVGPRKLTLAERLERFDPAKHGGEEMATGPVGAEVL
jgi:antitoxin MazE